jgi:hypothetical protein
MTMPVTDVRHREEWTMRITPDDGDEPWPKIQAYTTGPFFVPDKITVQLTRGSRHMTIHAEGGRVKKNGMPGENRSSRTFYSPAMVTELPDWLDELVEHERRVHSLGEGTVNPTEE